VAESFIFNYEVQLSAIFWLDGEEWPETIPGDLDFSQSRQRVGKNGISMSFAFSHASKTWNYI